MMRYRDAGHVDVGSFYARNARAGKGYRLIGYLGIVAAIGAHGQARCLGSLLIVLALCWFLAWYQVVGTLWRSSIVAAMLLCAVQLTLLKCPCSVMCATP
jgi:hypothetical protein